MANVNQWLLTGTLSAALVLGIKYWEGERFTPYKDVAGIVTVCYGYTGKDIQNKKYTPSECDALLEKSLYPIQKKIISCITEPINKNEFIAYSLFSYNVGAQAFCSSGANRELNRGNHELACSRLATHPNGSPAWSYADGKYYRGLQERRQFEKKICLGEISEEDIIKSFSSN